MKMMKMMKIVKFGLAVLILSLLAVSPGLVLSEEESAKYSFATAQGVSSLKAIPGGTEARGEIYFYNVDGNRITHITLEVVEAPNGWEVTINPPLHEQEVSFGGSVITIEENLYAEPTELHSEKIEDVPEGMVCLTLPNKLGPDIPGYTLAKVVTITVRVPESEEVGTTELLKINAVAEWLGQTGAAAIAQERDFNFTVATVYEVTEEKVLNGGFDVGRWLPVIIAVAVVALGAIFILRFRRPRRAQG